ncbi:MAG TPA: GyrI-like domain-containing protein [Proteobacteria bacterium]|nr:GyrI-like domain-containing protein [Pseudomonadota bacterium]
MEVSRYRSNEVSGYPGSHREPFAVRSDLVGEAISGEAAKSGMGVRERKDWKMKIEIKDVGPLKVASVDGEGTYREIGSVLMDLFRWVLERGEKVVSYPMALFPGLSEDGPAGDVCFEACIPVDPETVVKGGGGVTIRELPAATVAFVKHRGPLNEVGKTYDRILSWAGDNGYMTGEPTRELYLTNPMQFEEKDLITEVQVPVKAVRH